MIELTKNLSLEEFDGIRPESLVWYRNPEIQHLVNGTTDPYDDAQIKQMYDYQNSHGALYYMIWQEDVQADKLTIGDVWMGDEDFSLVIDPAFQHRGIGSEIVNYFLNQRALAGATEMKVGEVFPYNDGSNRLFEKLGFEKTTENGKTGYIFRFPS